jgi:hypothetical protein
VGANFFPNMTLVSSFFLPLHLVLSCPVLTRYLRSYHDKIFLSQSNSTGIIANASQLLLDYCLDVIFIVC